MTTLSDQQAQAVRAAVASINAYTPENLVTYIGGVAGSGKSTILPFMLDDLGFDPKTIAFVAPTGMAAKVMRTKLRDQNYPNFNTRTIHSAMYRAKPAPVAKLESDLAKLEAELNEIQQELWAENRAAYEGNEGALTTSLEKHPDIVQHKSLIKQLHKELENVYDEDKLHFQINPASDLRGMRLIVVDEASMVGAQMAADLKTFKVPILAIGDPCQLPPVDDDPGLTAGDPDFFLNEIHRQAADNPIIRLSQLAREGENLEYGDYGQGVQVIDREKWDYSGGFENRPQFICGMNKTRWKVTQMLRKDFGYLDNIKDVVGPRTGEPVVVKKNTKDYPNLVNGTQCTALSDFDLIHGNATGSFSFVDDENLKYIDKKCFQGRFEEHFSRTAGKYSAPKRATFRAIRSSLVLDWSYIITCHTSQGSQFDDVVVIDESSVFREDADKWLYTAVTRAAQKLIVLR